MVRWKLTSNVKLVVSKDPRDQLVPWNEGQIRVGDVITNKPFPILQLTIKNSHHPLNFFQIALSCAGNLLRVEVREPSCPSLLLVVVFKDILNRTVRNKALGRSFGSEDIAVYGTSLVSSCSEVSHPYRIR